MVRERFAFVEALLGACVIFIKIGTITFQPFTARENEHEAPVSGIVAIIKIAGCGRWQVFAVVHQSGMLKLVRHQEAASRISHGLFTLSVPDPRVSETEAAWWCDRS